MNRLLNPGERLERWSVLDRHLGSWGVVYVLRDLEYPEELARPEVVVAKTLRPEFVEDADRVARFEQECFTWLSLGLHKHIVRLFMVERFGQQPFAIGEYVPRVLLPDTLRGWLDLGLVEIEAALRFGIQMCRAMSYARGRGLLVHGDLKPENVMVTGSGVAKVTDWGLSRMVPIEVGAMPVAGDVPYQYGAREPGSVVAHGTRGYSAPELGSPGAIPTPQADLFSLAVVISEMISGRRPARGESSADLASWLSPLGRMTRRQISEIIAACTSPRPSDRPRSEAELESVMVAAFEELVGVPVEEPPTVGIETPADAGQRAYALFMLGKLDQAMKTLADVDPRREDADDSRGLAVLFDYKELGWKFVVSREVIDQAVSVFQSDPEDLNKLDRVINVLAMSGDLRSCA